MPITIPASNGLAAFTVPDVDECVQCGTKTELGRDYCATCFTEVVLFVRAAGMCPWCRHTLSEPELAEGYCSCGKPLNDSPPLALAESP